MLNKLQQKLVSMGADVKKVTEETIDLLPTISRVPAETQQARWNICNDCEKLYKPTSTCKLCGCFMKVKTHLVSAKCPANKWSKYAE